MATYKIETVGTAAYITTPYNPDFVARVKALSGHWDASSRRWKVKAQAVDAVRAAMMEIYGESDQPSTDERVTVIVRVAKEIETYTAPVTLFGKVVAAAYGRDTGARVGSDAAFSKGAPTSGGSARNWATVIPAGCEIEIYNVPRAMYERDKDNLPDGVTAELKPSTEDKPAHGIDALAVAIEATEDADRRAVLMDAYELVTGTKYSPKA